jgi:hypothetical protein
MRYRRFALAISVLALTSLAASPAFTAPVVYSKKVKAVGNSVSIKVSGNTQPVVQQTSNCSPGVSGYIYQSIVIFFAGGSISTTQSIYCP